MLGEAVLRGLLGIPFRDRGREPDGCDCWGLYRLAFHALTGDWLPSFAGDYAGRDDRPEIARLVEAGIGRPLEWRPVCRGDETTGDAALLVIRGTQHIGFIVRRGEMLHLPRDSQSVIEPLSRYEHALARGGLFRRAVTP